MIEALKHTPIWVFGVLIVLLVVGYLQSKDRKVSFLQVMILPIFMVGLSLYGVIGAFGFGKSLLFYMAGLVFGIWFNIFLNLPKNATFDGQKKVFFVQGSFTPLALMMCIFVTKYIVGFIKATSLHVMDNFLFIVLFSVIFGILSGMFVGRVFVLFKIKNSF